MTRAKDIPKILTDADISGNIDVDGVTNLDVVDIDGAVDMASTLTLSGALSAKGGVVFNEASADVDFRVESNADANMLFVEGGTDRVGIRTNSPSYSLDVNGDAKATRIIGNALMESSSGFSSDTFSVVGGTTSNQSTKHGGVFFSKHSDSNSLLVGGHDTAFNHLMVKGNGNVLLRKSV